MINEVIKKVYYPLHQDEWVIVETDNAFYELRLGGYSKTIRFESRNYKVVHKFSDNVIIEEAYTDEEFVYFLLSNVQYLTHGFTQYNMAFTAEEVDSSASVRIFSRDQFHEEYGDTFSLDPVIRKLKTDHQGNSV
jgi:hypothetical protein